MQRPKGRLQPRYLLTKARDHYQMYGPGKVTRKSREKMIYLKERKALKTIAIVFFGKCFILLSLMIFILKNISKIAASII